MDLHSILNISKNSKLIFICNLFIFINVIFLFYKLFIYSPIAHTGLFWDEAFSISSSEHSFRHLISWYSNFGETHPIWFDYFIGRMALIFKNETALRVIIAISNLTTIAFLFCYSKLKDNGTTLSLFLIFLYINHHDILTWSNLIRSYSFQLAFFSMILFFRENQKKSSYIFSLIIFSQLHFFSYLLSILATLLEQRKILSIKSKVFILLTFVPNTIYFSYILLNKSNPVRLIQHYDNINYSFFENLGVQFSSIEFSVPLLILGIFFYILKLNPIRFNKIIKKNLFEACTIFLATCFIAFSYFCNKPLVTTYNMIFYIPVVYIIFINFIRFVPFNIFLVTIIILANLNQTDIKSKTNYGLKHAHYEAIKAASKLKSNKETLLFCYHEPFMSIFLTINKLYNLGLKDKYLNVCNYNNVQNMIDRDGPLVWINFNFTNKFIEKNEHKFDERKEIYLIRR